MADVADPRAELLKYSAGKNNFMKLLTLVQFCGTKFLREVLKHYCPLKLLSLKVKRKIKRLKNKFSDAERKKLYPSRRLYGNIELFDITLMFKLLRVFSKLPAPRTGWNALPEDKDLTLSADVARIKYYRNKFSHDNGKMEVKDEEFKDVSSRIKGALVRMLYECDLQKTAAEWEDAIDDLLNGNGYVEDEIKFNQRIENRGTQLNKFLRDYYRSGERKLLLPFPSMEGKRFNINDLYTQVKIVKKDDDELIEMESLFSPSPRHLTKCKRILIEGEPGIGKSSLCKKIAYDWSMNKAPVSPSFPKFELVLVLKCAKLHHEDIWSAIEEEILPKELCSNKKEIWAYIQKQQEKVLLIIDGFDEIPAGPDSKTRKAVLNIMSGKMLSRCHLIVTSRTDKEPEIRNHFDKVLNIRGFQWKDSCNFFRRFFLSSSDKATEIISWIRSKGNDLKELVANPLYAAFTCLIFQENHQDKLDLFCFLQEIVFCVTKRYSVEKQDQQVSDGALMDKFQDEHSMLGKLALNVIKGNVDCFEERDIPYYLSQTLKDMGFLSYKKEMNRIRPKSCFYFSFSCIRKHFAEFYTY